MITGKEDLLDAIIEAYTMEKGTKEFYDFASFHSKTNSAKDMFIKLRDWEDTHMHYIGFLYQSFQEDREALSFEEFSKKIPTSHIESGVPVKEAEKLFREKDITNDPEAIKLALEIEGKAYNFYRNLSKTAEDSSARVVFGEMMIQEQKHINYLSKMKREIMMK